MGSNHFALRIGIAGCFQEFIFFEHELFLEENGTDTAETATLYGKNIVFAVYIDGKCFILFVLCQNRCILVCGDSGLHHSFRFLDVDITVALVIIQLVFVCSGNFLFGTECQHFIPARTFVFGISPCAFFHLELVERGGFIGSLYIQLVSIAQYDGILRLVFTGIPALYGQVSIQRSFNLFFESVHVGLNGCDAVVQTFDIRVVILTGNNSCS